MAVAARATQVNPATTDTWLMFAGRLSRSGATAALRTARSREFPSRLRQLSHDEYVSAVAPWNPDSSWWTSVRSGQRDVDASDAQQDGYVSPMPFGSRHDSVAILFDLDGTLIDSIELILNSARYAFEKQARRCPSDAEWLAGVGIPLATMFARYATDASDTTAFLGAYREYQLANHDRLVRCYAGVAETVRDLHEQGHPLAVVTSKSDQLALRGLSYVGLAQYMAAIVGTESSTRHKPDPEPVRIALERVARAPENAVFVGDSVHDIEAGNAAGVTTVAALWGPFSRAQLAPSRPDHYLDRISELPALIASLWT